MKETARELGTMLKATIVEWLEDDIPARGAALSYYVLLSLGPALVVIVRMLEALIPTADVRAGVVESLRDAVGPRAAETAAAVLERARIPDLSAPESLIAIVLFLLASTAAFTNVRGSLDKIWGIETGDNSPKRVILSVLRGRARGFLMILLTGFMLMLSFAVTSVAGPLINAVENGVPRGSALIVHGLDLVLSLLFTWVLFAAIFRTLPSIRIEWTTVWVGAFFTAVLFVTGESVVAGLIAGTTWTSYYGPGASAVTFLVWVYFSSQVFFFGAEFTQVWARHRGLVIGAEKHGPVPEGS